jgi:hypothetical protein
MKYQVKVYSSGRTIVVHNRQLRTPVSFIVNRQDLQQIKVQLTRLGVQRKEYSIQQIDDDIDDSINILPKEIILNNRNITNEPDQLSVPEIEELLGMEKKT